MIWMGFVVGLMSSLHCVGMCGPISLALPVQEGKSRSLSISIYHLGRILTYSIAGFIFGEIGHLSVTIGYQQYLSILCGIVIILSTVLSLGGVPVETLFGNYSNYFFRFKVRFTDLMKRRTNWSLLGIGLLNGLLPCGMVYIALLGAVATGDGITGSIYMALFGIGTAPLMFFLSYMKSISLAWRKNIIRIYLPVFSILLGCLLVLRGLNLGIPFLSPEFSAHHSTCCTVKHN